MILMLQYWESDKAQAMELARLIADLEDKPLTDVVFMFCGRWDCQHDQKAIDYVAKKFPVDVFTCEAMATGWPAGCNKMIGDGYKQALRLGKQRGWFNHPIMFLEADDVPLKKDWIDRIITEWKASGKMITGAWLLRDDCGMEHVNGNMCISSEFWKTCPAILQPSLKTAWDAALWPSIKPNAAPSREIWSEWGTGRDGRTFGGKDHLFGPKKYRDPNNPLYGYTLQPSLFHGVKTIEGLKIARQELVDKKTEIS